MDTNTLLIAGGVALGAVAIIALLRFRSKADLILKGPGGMKLDFKGSNELPAPRPAIQTGKLTAGRDIQATDATGTGIHVGEADAKRDVNLQVHPGSEEQSAHPKG